MCFSSDGNAALEARMLGHTRVKGLLLMIWMWLAG